MFCETDGKYEYVIASSLPTKCPVNPAHTIRDIVVISENLESLDGTPIELTLDEQKILKKAAIDKRTQELIVGGFTFNNTEFSTSDSAQKNWMAIDQLRNDLPYPFAVTTKDDGEYSFADAAEVHGFALTALGAIEIHYASGRALKLQVSAATTQNELDAVVDER